MRRCQTLWLFVKLEILYYICISFFRVIITLKYSKTTAFQFPWFFMMTIKYQKFFISWIIVAVLMFSLSYLWHGLLLNDFDRIAYPQPTFLTLAAVAYLFIGLIVVVANLFIEQQNVKEPKYILRGLYTGALCGLFIYLIAFVLGISFNSSPKPEYILFDLSWQIVEQAAGGVICGWIFNIFFIRNRAYA